MLDWRGGPAGGRDGFFYPKGKSNRHAKCLSFFSSTNPEGKVGGGKRAGIGVSRRIELEGRK